MAAALRHMILWRLAVFQLLALRHGCLVAEVAQSWWAGLTSIRPRVSLALSNRGRSNRETGKPLTQVDVSLQDRRYDQRLQT